MMLEPNSIESGLAPGPEAMWIGALLDGVRAGRDSPAASRAKTTRPEESPRADDAPVVELGPGDDAAILRPPEGTRLVMSSDASVEGIHFRRAWMTWETIGYRAAASALSDLAAMAAEPIGLTLSVALPPELDAGAASAIGRGVGEALGVSGGEILGGDLAASPGSVMIDVTVLGHAAEPVTRAGARPGDEIWVTGTLGGAGAAVADLQAGLEPLPEARGSFERPRPRIREARWLADRLEISALIDVSDGVGRDGRHIAAASGVRVDIEYDRLPAHPAVEPYAESEIGPRLLLSGGEDYELLFCVEGGAAAIAAEFSAKFGIDLTRIGHVSEGRGLNVVRSGGEVSQPDGFDHFGPEIG